MDFQEVVRRRRMVRNFEDRPLPAEAVERILANALRGPSAGFSQGFEFLVLEGSEQTERFWQAVSPDRAWERAGWPGVYNAPLIVVPLACKQTYIDRYAEPDKPWQDRDERHWPVPYWYIDTGFTALLILLAAVDEGLGAVFFGIQPEIIAEFRMRFGVPEQWTPIGAIAIGHPDPAGDPAPSSARSIARKRLDELVHRGQW